MGPSRQLVLFFCLATLLAMPAAGQNILGVLGGTAVGADDAGAVVRIDPDTGAATVLGIPIPGESLTGVAVTGSGRVLASTATFTGGSRLIEIDPETGALVATIGDFLVGSDPLVVHDLTFDPAAGKLYGLSIGASRAAIRSGAGDGQGTGGGRGRGGARFAGSGSSVAIAGGSPTDVNAVFEIDPATAACTYLGTPTGAPTGFLASAFLNGSLWAKAADSPTLFEIDPATGAIVNPVGGSGEGALGFGVLDAGTAQFVMSGCCENSTGNEIFRVDGATGNATLIGNAGGSRRVHDLVVLPTRAPVVDVPTLAAKGTVALALLLAVAGAALLFWRR